METLTRGFSNSFTPETSLDNLDMKMIEDAELERTWKVTRRQRQRDQEQKIWEEFVREQDVIETVLKEDPYQFLEQLPESYIQELLQVELTKMKTEVQTENDQKPPAPQQAKEVTVMFHETDLASQESGEDTKKLYDQNLDGQDNVEHDDADDSASNIETPHTVRERILETDRTTEDPSETKSQDNICNMIESSIYCAKVKELRIKLKNEIRSFINTLEAQNVASITHHDLMKMCGRSAEFCGRFQRIYLYQIQRQMHDIKRHNSLTLPFAKYTQFQSQMVRIVSLHQNILQSFQVFHKSVEQTACVKESASMLSTLVSVSKDADGLCSGCAAPHHFQAAKDLYTDDMVSMFKELEVSLSSAQQRAQAYLPAVDVPSGTSMATNRSERSKKSDKKKKNKTLAIYGKPSKTLTDARLSMYSLDGRHGVTPCSSKDMHTSAGTSKAHLASSKIPKMKRVATGKDAAAQNKKSPRMQAKSRRPLMRDPSEGKPRARPHRDSEIKTMVEAVEASSMSREASPRLELRHIYSKAYTSASNTPRRRPKDTPAVTPLMLHSPGRCRASSPRSPQSPRSPPSPPSPQRSPLRSPTRSPPLSRPPSPPARRCTPRTPISNRTLTPKTPKKAVPSPNRSTLSNIKSETLDSVPISPVSKIKCAVKEKTEKDDMPKVKVGPVETKIEKVGGRDSPRPRGERTRHSDSKGLDGPAACEVTRLLKQLCGGDALGIRSGERTSGAKNAQLVCVNGSSPRQPSTPQLLRILEETIQKKVPRSMYQKPKPKDADKYRLVFNISSDISDRVLQYRTRFIQYMLTSSMYANSNVGKPWEMISSISEDIVMDLLKVVSKEMEIQHVVQAMYENETH